MRGFIVLHRKIDAGQVGLAQDVADVSLCRGPSCADQWDL